MTQVVPQSEQRRIWAAVAFKGTVGGKRRLASLLSDEERARLGRAMLEDVLDSLLQVGSIETVLLVTPDASLADGLGRKGVRHVLDADPSPAYHGAPSSPRPPAPLSRKQARGSLGGAGLNSAFELAQRLAAEASVDGLLLMPADLPIISAAAVQAVLRAVRSPGIVLVPDRASAGTNALLVSPPMALRPSFGEGSFERHRQLAAEAGLDAVVVRRPTLALDLDTPSDVAALLAGGADCRARRVLVEIGADARLDAVLAAEAQAARQARSATI